MGIIFGKKKHQSRVTEQDRAVLQLKQQRDKLKQYQKRISAALESDRELAKRLLKDGKKDRAKLLLRKKRYQEQLLSKADAQLDNLEKMTHDIEFAQIEVQVVEGLKHGNEALKRVHDALDIADIERIMEETREGAEKQAEINQLLSGELTEEDEAAVEAELDEILQKQLPDVPIGEPEREVEEPKVEVDEPTRKEKERVKDREKTKVALEA